MTIGQKIQKIRELKDYSQDNLARDLGMSQQNYSKLENGKLPISDEVLSKIATILSVDKETLESFDTSMVFNNNN